jgi:hypothetical protein
MQLLRLRMLAGQIQGQALPPWGVGVAWRSIVEKGTGELGPWVLIRFKPALSLLPPLQKAALPCPMPTELLLVFVVCVARQLACFCLFTSPGPFHNTL